MQDIDELLESKYELLQEVLSLSVSVHYGADEEENILSFIDLYERRTEIFDKIKNIDENIIAISGDETSITNDEIKAIAKEILAFDDNYRKNEDEFKAFLNKKMKTINQSIKVNKTFNPLALSDIGDFSIEA